MLARFPILMTVFLGLAALAACANPRPGEVYYEDPQLPADQVAVLKWGGGVWGGKRAPSVTKIDGRNIPPGGLLVAGKLPQTRAKLLPGAHRIDFTYSVYRGYRPHAYLERSLTFDAEVGHVYWLKTVCERLGSFLCNTWIEDETAEVVVAGSFPDHIDRELAARSRKATSASSQKDHIDKLSASASCGDARAQYDLALYYLAGIEPLAAQDLVTAYAWFSLAESNGHHDAAMVRQRIAGDLLPQQLAEAKRLTDQARGRACEEQPDALREGAQPVPAEWGASS